MVNLKKLMRISLNNFVALLIHFIFFILVDSGIFHSALASTGPGFEIDWLFVAFLEFIIIFLATSFIYFRSSRFQKRFLYYVLSWISSLVILAALMGTSSIGIGWIAIFCLIVMGMIGITTIIFEKTLTGDNWHNFTK